MPCYTHKMAIVWWPQIAVTSLHLMYTINCPFRYAFAARSLNSAHAQRSTVNMYAIAQYLCLVLQWNYLRHSGFAELMPCYKGIRSISKIGILQSENGTFPKFQIQPIFSAFSPWHVDRRKCCQLSARVATASSLFLGTIRYDTIRDAILTCARKPT